MLCSACKSDIPDSAKFCPKCGVAPTPAPAALTPTKHCPKCGTEHAISAKFCKVDGHRFDFPEEAIQRPSSQPAAPMMSAQGQASTPVQWKKVRKWAGATVLLFVLVGGGAGVYLYYTGAFIGPAELKATISSSLVSKGIQGISVAVSDDRVATLSGAADDAAMKDAAVQIARSVKGVKDVLSKLEVLPSISDTESRLTLALNEHQLTDIVVKIDEKRNAMLTGNVSDPVMIEVATKTATTTLGVKNVISQVQVMALPAITYTDEPQPSTTQQPAPRPLSRPKAKSVPVTSGVPAPALTSVPSPMPATTPAPAPAPAAQAPAPTPERKRITCEGTGGIYRLTCTLEGPETYFKCAPDGRTWNHAISGCDRRSASQKEP